MSEQTIRLRGLFGYMPGEPSPVFLGAADAGAWEVTPEEEWQPIVQRWKEQWLGDWQSYDYREAFIEVPVSVDLFAAPTLPATVILPSGGDEER